MQRAQHLISSPRSPRRERALQSQAQGRVQVQPISGPPFCVSLTPSPKSRKSSQEETFVCLFQSLSFWMQARGRGAGALLQPCVSQNLLLCPGRAGHQLCEGSWNLTPGAGPGLHGSRGFMTGASAQLGGLSGLSTPSERKETKKSVVGAPSPGLHPEAPRW